MKATDLTEPGVWDECELRPWDEIDASELDQTGDYQADLRYVCTVPVAIPTCRAICRTECP